MTDRKAYWAARHRRLFNESPEYRERNRARSAAWKEARKAEREARRLDRLARREAQRPLQKYREKVLKYALEEARSRGVPREQVLVEWRAQL